LNEQLGSAPPADAERQLLAGLLAFQNNFIDRAALLTAFDAWTQDRSQSLVTRLVARGAISEEQRRLLDSLVDVFTARFEGDPRAGLQHISRLDSSLHNDLERRAAPDVQASLAIVGKEADPYATMAHVVGESTSTGTRFRILRPHARGGLGEIFVAADAELPREVALKQIQARHADDLESRSRFVQEAEITGALEHPNIVPVYGLGTYADGRPFYAMRFIKGDSLQDAAARFHAAKQTLTKGRGSLEFRKLLQRFIDVCNAIDYAHSRGVLHRDLKPGNVMLGKYGETLVVDWGLAKTLGVDGRAPAITAATPDGEEPLRSTSGSGNTPTEHGSVIGTPGYMSPEQATGRTEDLGPASDVYGLGATLYHLLAGTAPFAGDDLGELLRRIASGTFPAPKQINASVPAGLQAICLKAMSLAPADRYPTPRALADDIEHWLADERVAALPESQFERAARWFRKHRTFTRAAALVLTVTCATSITAAVLISRARDEAVAAKNEAVAARNEATAARDEAVDARDEAERNFRLATDAVNDYFTHVSQDVVLLEAGLQNLRNELLNSAAEYYEKLLTERRNDSLLSAEHAAAKFRLEFIRFEQGRSDASVDPIEAAADEFRRTVASRPDDDRLKTEYVEALSIYGFVLHRRAAFDRAREVLVEAESLVRDLERRQALAGRERHCTLLWLVSAENEREAGRNDRFQTCAAEAVRWAEAGRKARPNGVIERQLLAGAHGMSAFVEFEAQRPIQAAFAIQQAVGLLEQLLKERPRNYLAATQLAIVYGNLAGFQERISPMLAAASLQRAVELSRDVAEQNPLFVAGQFYHVTSLQKLARLSLKANRIEEARRESERASVVAKRALALGTQEPKHFSYSAAGYSLQAEIEAADGRDEQSLAYYQSAVDLLRESMKKLGFLASLPIELSAGLRGRAAVLERRGRIDEATADYREAVETLEKASKAGIHVRSDDLLAIAYKDFAAFLVKQGLDETAEGYRSSAFELCLKRLRATPKNRAYCAGLLEAAARYGETLRKLSKTAAAIEMYDRGLAEVDKYFRDNPTEQPFATTNVLRIWRDKLAAPVAPGGTSKSPSAKVAKPSGTAPKASATASPTGS
jgi:serine/threonine-protein kinase